MEPMIKVSYISLNRFPRCIFNKRGDSELLSQIQTSPVQHTFHGYISKLQSTPFHGNISYPNNKQLNSEQTVSWLHIVSKQQATKLQSTPFHGYTLYPNKK